MSCTYLTNIIWKQDVFIWFGDCLSFHSPFTPNHSGVGAARSGNLTFMVGGVEEEFAAAKELLGCMGSHVVYCGAVGTGQVTCSFILMALARGVKLANVHFSFLTMFLFLLTLFNLCMFCWPKFS